MTDRYHTKLYYLQSIARKIFVGERVCACCRIPIPNRSPEIWGNVEQRRVKFRNVARCKSLWLCPVCANNITACRRSELEKVLSAYAELCVPVMLSFTVRHHREYTLFDTLRTLTEAWRAMTKGKAWSKIQQRLGLRGMVRSLEITWSDRNGWHPHFHVVLLVSKSEMGALAKQYDAIRQRWIAKVAEAGGNATWENGCQLTVADNSIAAYVAKWAHEPKPETEERLSRWGIATEATRGIAKEGRRGGMTPWDMLVECSQQRGFGMYAKLLHEYAEAVHGERQITWSRGLKASAGIAEKSDEEIVEGADGGYVFLAAIDSDDWPAIIEADAQGAILDCASRGDLGMMRDIIEDCKTDLLKRMR
jgi:hypothetical protein